LVKISGGDDLTDEQQVSAIQAATGVSEKRARGMLARSRGRVAGDITYGGVPRDLQHAEPVFVIYVASETTESVRAIRSDDDWRFWRSWKASERPSTGPVIQTF
jgi:hypothetical protein